MERSTAVPLGRWLKAGEGECGTPIVGFWGGTEVAGVAVSSLRQTKQDKPCSIIIVRSVVQTEDKSKENSSLLT